MVRWLHALLIVLALALLTAVTYHSMTGESGGMPTAPRSAMPPGHPKTGPGDPASVLAPVPQNRPAPPFAAAGRDGKPKALASLRGRYVLLNFWATWCEPCRDELPHLAALAKALTDKPVQIVLVTVDKKWSDVDTLVGAIEKAAAEAEDAQAYKDAAAMLRGELPNVLNLIDPESGIPHSYGTQKFPETYLIDPEGRIRTHFIGPKAWAQPEAVGYLTRSVTGQGGAQARMPHPPGGPAKPAPAADLPPGHPPLDGPADAPRD